MLWDEKKIGCGIGRPTGESQLHCFFMACPSVGHNLAESQLLKIGNEVVTGSIYGLIYVKILRKRESWLREWKSKGQVQHLSGSLEPSPLPEQSKSLPQ